MVIYARPAWLQGGRPQWIRAIHELGEDYRLNEPNINKKQELREARTSRIPMGSVEQPAVVRNECNLR